MLAVKIFLVPAAIAEAIKRMSLNLIKPWFSSPSDNGRGLMPGKWFDSVFHKMDESKAVLVLLTDKSIDKPWIFYESGYAQARDIPIVPLYIGLRMSRNTPLSAYQGYSLTDYHRCVGFFHHLFQLFGFTFYEDVAAPIIKKMLNDIQKNL